MSDKKTIVYLHGLNCSGIGFNYLISKLPDHHAVVINYNSRSPIEKIVKEVEKKLPKGDFALVGHSLGGVVSLLVAEGFLPAEKVVTISSPIGGTSASSFVRWILPEVSSVADLAPLGKICRHLKNHPIEQPVLSIISVGGSIDFFKLEKNDSIVSVDSQSSYGTKNKKKVDANHFEVLQHPETVKAIRSFLFE